MLLSHACDRAVVGGFGCIGHGLLGHGLILWRSTICGFRACGPVGKCDEAIVEYLQKRLNGAGKRKEPIPVLAE